MVRVLVVDDEKELARHIGDYLAAQELDVTVSHGTREALEFLRNAAGPIDVLVTDIRMPGGTGLELTAEALSLQPDLGVIVMTAYSSPGSELQALRTGALRFLEKPLDLAVLHQRILEVARLTQQGPRPVGGLTILEVAEFLYSSGETAVLQITGPEKKGLLIADEGTIVSASTDHVEGEEAFLEMVLWGEVAFSSIQGLDPPAHAANIARPTPELLKMSQDFARTLGSRPDSDQHDGLISLGVRIARHEDLPDLAGEPSTSNHAKEAENMATMMDILKQLAAQLPGTQGAVVVGADGLPLAQYAAAPSFNADAVAAQLVMLSKLAERTAKQLAVGTTEDTQITTDAHYVLIRPIGDSSIALAVVVNRAEGTLGMVRMVTSQLIQPLYESLPRKRK